MNSQLDFYTPCADEVRIAEKKAIESGYSSEMMIACAGRKLFETIRKQILHCSRKKILVISGKGNNGKDGMVLAENLIANKFDCAVFQIDQKKSLTSSDKDNLEKLIFDSEVVIDAILGMGQKGDPHGIVKEVVLLINSSLENARANKLKIITIAVDVPTGINSDTGEVYFPALQADYTISVQWHKRGLFQYPARQIAGKLLKIDINLSAKSNFDFQVYKPKNLPQRPGNVHKGSFGKVYVFSGVSNTFGAGILASCAALKIGAPLVYLVESENSDKNLYKIPELMSLSLLLDEKSIEDFFAQLTDRDVVVIGPGFGLSSQRKETFCKIINSKSFGKKHYTVFDADALTLISQSLHGNSSGKNQESDANIVNKIDTTKTVFTPHPKEASRLLNISVEDIESNRYQAFMDLQILFPLSSMLLKGASSIATDSSSAVHINGSTNLATGGSGDVLSGMIAGLLAQASVNQFDVKESLNLAVYLHAQCANQNPYPVMVASDIIKNIPLVLEQEMCCG